HTSVARQQVPPGLPRLRTFSATVLMVLFAFTGRTQGATLAAWVQLVGPDDKSIIRVVTNSSDCPVVTADGEELPMDLRAGPARLYDPPQGKEAPVFGVRTCQLASPEGRRCGPSRSAFCMKRAACCIVAASTVRCGARRAAPSAWWRGRAESLR